MDYSPSESCPYRPTDNAAKHIRAELTQFRPTQFRDQTRALSRRIGHQYLCLSAL